MMKPVIKENWHSEPTKNLENILPLKDVKKLYDDKTTLLSQKYTWEDIQGLSWIFINDEVV